MGPLLRSPEQGADTVVWLAASPEAVESTGGFWLDRRPRWEHKVPWTRLSADEFGAAGIRAVGLVCRTYRLGRPDRHRLTLRVLTVGSGR